jgi:DNA-binding IclR family transcriptional regulator
VKLITASPGISASEIAKQMKIKPNYLYRVLAELEKEGRVRKDGRAYHPAG